LATHGSDDETVGSPGTAFAPELNLSVTVYDVFWDHHQFIVYTIGSNFHTLWNDQGTANMFTNTVQEYNDTPVIHINNPNNTENSKDTRKKPVPKAVFNNSTFA